MRDARETWGKWTPLEGLGMGRVRGDRRARGNEVRTEDVCRGGRGRLKWVLGHLAERGRELEPAIGGRGVLVVGVEWGWQSTLS